MLFAFPIFESFLELLFWDLFGGSCGFLFDIKKI